MAATISVDAKAAACFGLVSGLVAGITVVAASRWLGPARASAPDPDTRPPPAPESPGSTAAGEVEAPLWARFPSNTTSDDGAADTNAEDGDGTTPPTPNGNGGGLSSPSDSTSDVFSHKDSEAEDSAAERPSSLDTFRRAAHKLHRSTTLQQTRRNWRQRSSTLELLGKPEEEEEAEAEVKQLINEEELRMIFVKMSTQALRKSMMHATEARLSLREFERICIHQLKLNLSSTEIARFFKRIDKSGRNFLDFRQFLECYNNMEFMKSIVTNYASTAEFEVPEDFDFFQSTAEFYKNEQSDDYHGDFVEFRKQFDYTYHVNYTKERQLWQDEIVKNISHRINKQERPWVVYTCGPMGAGKGYALSWMSKHGFFPLEDIVHIDPDHFKELMPEWEGYKEFNPEMAGTLCHLESGYIQQIAQQYALTLAQHVWVDGSLRDGEWFSKVFDGIRKRFPNYSIAIFYVYASEAEIRRRVAKRAEETGRSVPEEKLASSLLQPDRSLRLLTPKVDFVARINNDTATPVLEAFEVVDHSGSWNAIKKIFARKRTLPSVFPESLPPVYLERTSLEHEDFVYEPIDEATGNTPVQLRASTLAKHLKAKPQPNGRANGEGSDGDGAVNILEAAEFVWSPPHVITMDPASRDVANIPEEAHSFAYAFPAHPTAASKLDDTADGDFITHGGFIYFDQDDYVLAVNANSPTRKDSMIQFGPGRAVPLECMHALQDRWWPVRHHTYSKKGAEFFTWMVPMEKFAGKRLSTLGAMVYLFGNGKGVYFPVIE